MRYFVALAVMTTALVAACTKAPAPKNSAPAGNINRPASIATPGPAGQKNVPGKASITPDFASPKSAIDTFVAAAQAQDQGVLSQCFDPENPGEYQTLIDKTASESQLTRLAVQFEEAKVGVIRTDGDLATVKIAGKNSSGEIHLKKTAAGWKVLDF